MAHKVKVSETNYAVKKGLCTVNGTNYVVYGGKTKIGSTNYWIDLSDGKSVTVSVSGSMNNYFAHVQGSYISCAFDLNINGNYKETAGNYTAKTGQTIRISGSGERYSSSSPSPSTLMGDAPLRVCYNGTSTTYTGGFNLTYRITDDMTIRFEDNCVYIDVGGVNLTKTGSPTGTWYYQHPCATIACGWTSTVKVNGTDMSAAGTVKIAKNSTVVVTNKLTPNADFGARAIITYNGSTVATAAYATDTASYTFTATGSYITITYPSSTTLSITQT